MSSHHNYWNTKKEMEFLDGLGGFKLQGQSQPRHKLLRNYYKAAKKRKNWGDIDEEKVVRRVASELGWNPPSRFTKKPLTRTKK
jgi:hypothetical protein